MHAVDSVLLIKEVNWNMFSGIFQEERLHAAMVCPTASMEHDYERLELLGGWQFSPGDETKLLNFSS